MLEAINTGTPVICAVTRSMHACTRCTLHVQVREIERSRERGIVIITDIGRRIKV